MKYKNFEVLAKKIAKRLNTTIARFNYNSSDYDSVWFDNNFCVVLSKDDTWFTIFDYSKENSQCVMKCFLNDYATQKRFFEDMEIYLNQYDEICHEKELAEQATCINTICDNNKESEDKTMTNEIELRETASNLYDGGWRASDREYLKAEYDFSEWELDIICEALLDFEA